MNRFFIVQLQWSIFCCYYELSCTNLMRFSMPQDSAGCSWMFYGEQHECYNIVLHAQLFTSIINHILPFDRVFRWLKIMQIASWFLCKAWVGACCNQPRVSERKVKFFVIQQLLELPANLLVIVMWRRQPSFFIYKFL